MDVATPAVSASAAVTAEEEDLYTRLKTLQRQLEFLEIQARRAVLTLAFPPHPGKTVVLESAIF
jgi:hypothetical protein